MVSELYRQEQVLLTWKLGHVPVCVIRVAAIDRPPLCAATFPFLGSPPCCSATNIGMACKCLLRQSTVVESGSSLPLARSIENDRPLKVDGGKKRGSR